MSAQLGRCDHCASPETRLFEDTWTGLRLCINCLSQVIDHTTMDPEEEEAGPAGLRNALNRIVPQD